MTEPDHIDVSKLIDIDRYPINDIDSEAREKLVTQCRRDLHERALCQLPGFIRPAVIDQIIDTVAPTIQSARFREEMHCLDYEAKNTDDLPHDHPLRILQRNRYQQILNYQIGNDSLLRRLYMWDVLTAFVRDVYGHGSLHRSQCPHLALSLKIEDEGDTDGWHYDRNDGVVSLLLQQPDDGGEFQYAPYIRSERDQNYDAVTSVLADPENKAIQPEADAGTFIFFNGRRSLHRVSPVGRTSRPRVIALLCYDQTADHVFPQSYIDYLQKLPMGRPLN